MAPILAQAHVPPEIGVLVQTLGNSKVEFGQVWLQSLPAAPDLLAAMEAVGLVRQLLGQGQLLRGHARELGAGTDIGSLLPLVWRQDHWVDRIVGLLLLCECTDLALTHLAQQYPQACGQRWDKLLAEEGLHKRFAMDWLQRLARAGGQLPGLACSALAAGSTEVEKVLAGILEGAVWRQRLAEPSRLLRAASGGALA